MNIIGPDALVFGVDDLAAAAQYMKDYGLTDAGNGVFEAQDGTAIVIKDKNDASLPAPLPTGNAFRKTIWGCADQASVDAIAAEFLKDREVKKLADGSIELVDDLGFVLGFRVTQRRALSLPVEKINAPGAPWARKANELGVVPDAPLPKPRTIGHFAVFVPDSAKGEAFYKRIGFRATDRLGAGMFLQSDGAEEHHQLFLIQTPPQMQGMEHIAFHLAGPQELMTAGIEFQKKGYSSFWGPGRHIMGSNWFWYFNSPLGCRFEFDADMDVHDKSWQPRSAAGVTDNTQAYLLQLREKWSPLGPPPGAGAGGPPGGAH
jgi:catechol 2,3-dioxygenase-like lactoylglutathione lyase family enzyme